MKACLDDNGYFTGDYCTVGDIEGGIEVSNIPIAESNNLMILQSYRYDEGSWVFDENRYNQLLALSDKKVLDNIKSIKIIKSKELLKKYLDTTTITSNCHKGVQGTYSITSEKQQHLANMILTATMAGQAGIPYQPSWNETGKPCSYDWTLEELQQLAFEIESVVRPAVSKQQIFEDNIMAAQSKEELDAIIIDYSV